LKKNSYNDEVLLNQGWYFDTENSNLFPFDTKK